MTVPGDDLDRSLCRDVPGQVFISTPSDSTTAKALPEVQQMSDSAFTAADVLT
ncbi:hypothetical protein X741_28720 [Mesorhizobium sp. LNHC229A00]|nr:hypothetical protein X741_28720 [Mesorhizobium sp. LNHC229A00]